MPAKKHKKRRRANARNAAVQQSKSTRKRTRSASAEPAARTALTPFDEQCLRRRLRRAACSEPWVDAQIVTLTDTAADGASITSARYHDPTVFPPGGRAHTTMKWCRHCGRYTPPNCINLIEHRRRLAGPVTSATLRCDDCRIALDVDTHHQLYEALPHLKPSGSLSFVKLRELFAQRRHMR